MKSISFYNINKYANNFYWVTIIKPRFMIYREDDSFEYHVTQRSSVRACIGSALSVFLNRSMTNFSVCLQMGRKFNYFRSLERNPRSSVNGNRSSGNKNPSKPLGDVLLILNLGRRRVSWTRSDRKPGFFHCLRWPKLTSETGPHINGCALTNIDLVISYLADLYTYHCTLRTWFFEHCFYEIR